MRYESHTELVSEHVGEDASILFGIHPENIYVIHSGLTKTIETVLELLELVGPDKYPYFEMEGVEKCRLRVISGVKIEG